jgi:hopene-associated glycosyltransferase HpnB
MVELAASAAAGAWLYLTFGQGQFWRVRPAILPAAAPQRKYRVVAVIPARDEAPTIGITVRSLTQQTDSVIVVDDNSSDRTGDVAREAGATVVSGQPLPPGWTGKMWALSQGVEAALASRPDFLLFTDADIVHADDSVPSLVAKAESAERDLVSVMVRLRCQSTAERFLIPAFVFFFFQLYPPSWTASRGRSTAGAAGGCVLIRPDALGRAGGIEAIRAELIDDCALANAVKRSGGSLWLGLADMTRSLRPYPRFADIRHMIRRTAFTQLRYSAPMLLGTVLGLAFLYLLPVAAALAGIPAGLVAWALMAAIYVPMARFYGQPVLSGLLLPAVAAFYMVATVESAVRYWTGRGGNWKGRNQAPAAAGRL